MNARITINARTGVIEAEGELTFVKEVYADFKERILPMMADIAASADDAEDDTKGKEAIKIKVKKRSPPKKSSSPDASTSSINADNPTLDKNLDTSGIQEFYDKYLPANHAEKILIFARFLKDQKSTEKANTNQIYTCYSAVGEKPAAAFSQSFRDTSSKKFGYIDYKSANEIVLTFIGNRYFDHDLKKKVAE